MERMREIGMALRAAVGFVQSRPAELIERALNVLPLRKPKRPAAMLYAELMEGGWEEPPELVRQRIREQEEAERERKRVEQAEAERRREVAEEARARSLREEFAGLPPEDRAELLAEARSRIAWAARLPGALDEGSPVLWGAIVELLEDRARAAA
ncbi:MAG: hypothetical protein K8I02_13165 [Candidatus Methylomirabilis sp.]|nr:hypothetical protein [Deltaproteobacteria bacterium]